MMSVRGAFLFNYCQSLCHCFAAAVEKRKNLFTALIDFIQTRQKHRELWLEVYLNLMINQALLNARAKDATLVLLFTMRTK